jgi:basic membrane protein A and related proteins
VPARRLVQLLMILTFGLAALVAAGCGDDEESNGGGSAAQSTPEQKSIKVGIVTDIGGLNDRGFNQSANEGLKRAISELGVEGRALTSDSNADYVPNLSSLAQQRYDLVIGIGFLMADAVNTVATKFPQTNFAIVDAPNVPDVMKDTPANVRGLIFKENEAGYLVGTLAGLYVKDKGGDQVVSSVGGQKVPAVDAFIAGYEAGAKEANPDVNTLSGYSEDFVRQNLCKELALNQIAEGSQVVFAVAGQCGLGALDAAKERNLKGIGVDADQGYLGPHVITSAIKKVDVAVFDTIKAVQDGTFKGGEGEDAVYDAKAGGVGFGKLSSDGAKYEQQLNDVLEQIKSGELTDIPAEVK